MPVLLSRNEITSALTELDGWGYSDNALHKTWQRKGLGGAMQLANVIAYVADQVGHHPNIAVHDYDRVTVTATTHDAGGVTSNDLELARRIDRAANA